LKKYVKDATDIIEKSEHKDHVFEVAGHLIHGIPDVLMRLDKALNAAAMGIARLDYTSVKNELRPEKADELESALNDTRLRYLNRRSTSEDTMDRSAKLMFRQEAVLKKYLESAGSRAVMDYDALPADVKAALSKVKDQETLASDVDRWLMDHNNPHMRSATTERTSPMNAKTVAYFLNKIAALTEKEGHVPLAATMTLITQLERGSKKASILNSKAAGALRNMADAIQKQKNPSRVEIASVLRRIVGDTLSVGIEQAPQQGQGPQGQEQQAVQQQAPQQGQGQPQQQQAGAGEQFQKVNPGISDEEVKLIDTMHEKHRDTVIDKNK
jgi:hypothetical protein